MALEEYGRNCILIRNALTMEEQMELFEALEKEMANQPEEFQTQGAGQLAYEINEEFTESVPFRLLSKAIDFIKKNYELKGLKDITKYEVFCCDALTYNYPDGSLARHCDNRRDKSVVFLYTIGCTANFYVHTPEMKGEAFKDGKVLKFKSGEMLFFDATKAANMVHGVDSIENAETCPPQLKEKYKELSQKRISVQIRAS